MSPPDKPTPKRTPAESWEALEKRWAADEAESVRQLSRAELEAEVRAAGGDPEAQRAKGRAFEEELARALAARAGGARRVRGTGYYLALAAAVALGLSLAGLGVAAVAGLFDRHDEIRPDDTHLTPAMRAARLRDEGLKACDAEQWPACQEKLDEAEKLDPAGESEPRVAAARARIHDALAPREPGDGGEKDKPTPH